MIKWVLSGSNFDTMFAFSQSSMEGLIIMENVSTEMYQQFTGLRLIFILEDDSPASGMVELNHYQCH